MTTVHHLNNMSRYKEIQKLGMCYIEQIRVNLLKEQTKFTLQSDIFP